MDEQEESSGSNKRKNCDEAEVTSEGQPKKKKRRELNNRNSTFMAGISGVNLLTEQVCFFPLKKIYMEDRCLFFLSKTFGCFDLNSKVRQICSEILFSGKKSERDTLVWCLFLIVFLFYVGLPFISNSAVMPDLLQSKLVTYSCLTATVRYATGENTGYVWLVQGWFSWLSAGINGLRESKISSHQTIQSIVESRWYSIYDVD